MAAPIDLQDDFNSASLRRLANGSDAAHALGNRPISVTRVLTSSAPSVQRAAQGPPWPCHMSIPCHCNRGEV